jgi:membrane-associated protease RseP (regulator of RpoE activity)
LAIPFFKFLIIGELLVSGHSLAHVVLGTLLGVHVQEVSLLVGPTLVQIPIGSTLWRINCIPWAGGYVKFAGQDPTEHDLAPPPGLRRFTDLRPLSRVLVVLGAPLAFAAVGAAILGPSEFARWVVRFPGQVVQSHLHPYAHLAPLLREFIQSFSSPDGLRHGSGVLCAFIALTNLVPIPLTCGGEAMRYLLSGIFPRAGVDRWFNALSPWTLLCMLASFAIVLAATYRALFQF